MDKPAESLETQTPAPEVPARSETPVVTIPRDTFNYVVIAVAFFALGVMIGAGVYDRLSAGSRADTQALIDASVQAALEESQASIDRAVAAALGNQNQNAQANAAPDPNQRYDVALADNPMKGSAEAPVTIVEFSDFRCPYCSRFASETLDPLIENYEGQVRLVYRDYPILGPESLNAALASECADDQGKYWEYHDGLFANQAELGRDLYLRLATELDLDVEQFTTCYDNQEHRDEVINDYVDGEALGVSGTPTFFINGRFVSGAQPYEVFARMIDEELAALEGEGSAADATS